MYILSVKHHLISSLSQMTRVFLPAMIERRNGHIVTISSLSGIFGAHKMLMYATSKFAVRGFMESLTNDLYMAGHSDYIKMTTIFPCFVNSTAEISAFCNENLKPSNLLKPIKVEKVVSRIVKAIQFEERIVTIPGFLKLLGFYM